MVITPTMIVTGHARCTSETTVSEGDWNGIPKSKWRIAQSHLKYWT